MLPGVAETLLLVKLGVPRDSTLWLPEIQVHVTVPPTATVSTAGFVVPFPLLVKKISPTWTEAVVPAGAGEVTWRWNQSGSGSGGT